MGGPMSEHVPLPDSTPQTEDRRAAADPHGPVPGQLDLSREAQPAVPLQPSPHGLSEAPAPEGQAAPESDDCQELPHLQSPHRGRRLVQKPATPPSPLTPQQRLRLVDTWQRSGLPAGDFAALVGLSRHTLYSWKKKFDTEGPAGLLDQPRGGPGGSKLPELTKRTILLLKQSHPDWGCQKISDLLLRGPALPASPAAVARVLHEAGYQFEEVTTPPHPHHCHSLERPRPNQLWQTDLFTSGTIFQTPFLLL